LEQPKGISFLQTGMEIDMGEVDLVFGFCVYYNKNPEQRRAQQLVLHNCSGDRSGPRGSFFRIFSLTSPNPISEQF